MSAPMSRFAERRGRRGRPRLFAVIVVAAIQIGGSRIAARGSVDTVPLDGLAYGLLLAGPVALLVRRRSPLAALAIALAATVAYVALDYPRGPIFLAPLIAVIGAIRRANRPAAGLLTAAAFVVYVVLTPGDSLAEHIVVGVGALFALMLSEMIRVQGSQIAEQGRARAEAARAKQEQSRRQASDERLRIARELHDVLGHHLSLINVRAGVALHLIDEQPDQAREALAAIKQASAEALRDVRGVLAALSDDDGQPPRSPAPGLADLDRLVDEARAAGLAVTLDSPGRSRVVPAGVDRAAYRIVQEALTNVRRHAGPAPTVTIVVRYGPRSLTLTIADDGVGAPAPPRPAAGSEPAPEPGPGDEGNGIPGMRERAAALGGTLTAGPGPAGGFQVVATLPLPADEPDKPDKPGKPDRPGGASEPVGWSHQPRESP